MVAKKSVKMDAATRLANTRRSLVKRTLEAYAERGVFKGFGAEESKGEICCRVVWHFFRQFEFHFNPDRDLIRIPVLLPNADAALLTDLKAFIDSRYSVSLPPHRRVDRERVLIKAARRAGIISLSAEILDGDDVYATKQLVYVVQEIFLNFLTSGMYYDYLVENFDLDPDRI